MSSPRIAIVLAAIAAFALTGCASTGSNGGTGSGDLSTTGSSERTERGVPAEWDGPAPDPEQGEPIVGWIGETEFGVVTMGSSSCPPVVTDYEASDAGHVHISFEQSPNEVCTADMAPTTHVFALPDGVTDRPVAVDLTFELFDEEFSYTRELN